MTLQKIIDVMKKHVTKKCKWDDAKCHRKIDCDKCSFNNAMTRDTLKKPLEKHYENEGEEPYIKYCCPNGCRVQLIPPTGKGLVCETLYCPKCGQAIDWRGKDER